MQGNDIGFERKRTSGFGSGSIPSSLRAFTDPSIGKIVVDLLFNGIV